MPETIPDLFSLDALSQEKASKVNEIFHQHLEDSRIHIHSGDDKEHINAVFALAQVATYSTQLNHNNHEIVDLRFPAMKVVAQYIMKLSEDAQTSEIYEQELLIARLKLALKITMEQIFRDPDVEVFKNDEYTLNLSHINLSNQKLYDIDLRQAHLTGSIFSGANMSGANLSGASLYKSAFIETNLLEADLSYAQLIRSDLTRANLTRANLDHTYLNQADLTEADLTRAKVSIATLTNVKFDQTMLTGGNWDQTNMNIGDLSGADLTGADLSHIELNNEYLKTVISDNFKIPVDSFHVVRYEYLKNGVFDIIYSHNEQNHDFKYHISAQKIIPEELLLTYLTNFSYWKFRLNSADDAVVLDMLDKFNYISMGWSKEFRKFEDGPNIQELQEIYKAEENYTYDAFSKSKLNRFNNIQLNDVIVIPHPTDEDTVKIGTVVRRSTGFEHAMKQDGHDISPYTESDIGLVVKLNPTPWLKTSDIPIPDGIPDTIWQTDQRTIIRFNKIKPVLEKYLN